MRVSHRFVSYLDHLGSTVPVRTLYEDRARRDVVALRHDVDHDLDAALELAYWERERGCRASYFLLHTAAYWEDRRLVEKALQLQDFSHEVGLHVNVLVEWMRGDIDDPDARLPAILGRCITFHRMQADIRPR